MSKYWQQFLASREARKQRRVRECRASQNAYMKRMHSFRVPEIEAEWIARDDETVANDQEFIEVFGCGWQVMVERWENHDRACAQLIHENFTRIPKRLAKATP